MLSAIGESASMVIIVTNHMFLFDSAYARRAEKAKNRVSRSAGHYSPRNRSDILTNESSLRKPVTMLSHLKALQLRGCEPISPSQLRLPYYP